MSISSRVRSIEWPSIRWPSSWPGRPRGKVGPPRLRAEIWLVLIVVASVLVIGVVALVQSGDSFDRAGAVARTVDGSAGRLTESQAECYVDGVKKQLGRRYLAPDASVPDDVAAKMTSIRVDCVGVANLGVATTVDPADPSATAAPSTEAGNLPRQRGDDPTLDALYDQCALGSGQACDDLFNLSPVGSAYESFAITCGNRTTQRRCADVYLLPESTTTAAPPAADPAAPAITGPPAPAVPAP